MFEPILVVVLSFAPQPDDWSLPIVSAAYWEDKSLAKYLTSFDRIPSKTCFYFLSLKHQEQRVREAMI